MMTYLIADGRHYLQTIDFEVHQGEVEILISLQMEKIKG